MQSEKIEERTLLEKSELSIWLDTYDDIFSDFDPRPLNERALSDDFISEARKMARDTPSGNLELKLLMPGNLRDRNTELIITKTLHAHFNRWAKINLGENRQTRNKGFLSGIIGLLLMVINSYIINMPEKSFWMNTAITILEPAGWFMLWTGFDFIIYRSRDKKSELNFNRKMAGAKIIFISI